MLIKILFLLVILGCVWIIIKTINMVIRIRRADKIEKIRTANEEIEATLAAGAVAQAVTPEERERLCEAKDRIEDRVGLGQEAK